MADSIDLVVNSLSSALKYASEQSVTVYMDYDVNDLVYKFLLEYGSCIARINIKDKETEISVKVNTLSEVLCSTIDHIVGYVEENPASQHVEFWYIGDVVDG